MLIVMGVNYKKTAIDMREKLSFTADRTRGLSCDISGLRGVMECVVLSTCNRFEIYLHIKNKKMPVRVLAKIYKLMGVDPETFGGAFYSRSGADAVRHLFMVACGLDSMVSGESQILKQVKDAHAMALELKTSSSVLNRLFNHAVMAGKRVRSETGIGGHNESISSLAVRLVRDAIKDIKNRSVLLIGAGEMAELALAALVKNGVDKVYVASRTAERAKVLSEKYEMIAAHASDIYRLIETVDIIISSTSSPHYIIERAEFRKCHKKRPGRPLIIIDIAVPRDVDPAVGRLKNVFLYNIDDINRIASNRVKIKKCEAAKASNIVVEEADAFLEWLSQISVMPFISKFRAGIEAVIRKETEKFEKKLGRDAPLREDFDELVKALVNRLTAPLINKIRSCAASGNIKKCMGSIECVYGMDRETGKCAGCKK